MEGGQKDLVNVSIPRKINIVFPCRRTFAKRWLLDSHSTANLPFH